MSGEHAPDGNATDFAGVLNTELGLITIRRERVRAKAPRRSDEKPEDARAGSSAADGNKTDVPAPENSAPKAQKEARLDSLHRHVAGLALSGGGIRSATFALGVLQGLADLKILSRFDYLSTVSGGGYVGGWLAAWMKREGDPLAVEKQLSPSRVTEAEADRVVIGGKDHKKKIVDEEPEPIHHLRSYSNYLTPRPGLLSVDTWTLLTIYTRNALINMLLLLPLTILIVLLGRCVVWFYALPSGDDTLRVKVFYGFLGSFGLALLSLVMHIRSLQSGGARASDAHTTGRSRSPANWPLNPTVIWPLVLAAVLAGWSFSLPPAPGIVTIHRPSLPEEQFRIRLPDGPRLVDGLQPNVDWSAFGFLESIRHFLDPSETTESAYEAWKGTPQIKGRFLWWSALEFGTWFGLIAAGVHIIGYVALWTLGRDPDTLARSRGEPRNRLANALYMVSCSLIAGFTGGILFLAVISEVLWRQYDLPDLVTTLGPPLILGVFVLATFIEVWLLGRWQGDDLREWWARICAWLTIYALAWLAFFGLTLYGPMLMKHVLTGPWLRSGAVLGWLATAAGGAVAGRNPKSNRIGGDRWVRLLVNVAPSIFVAGLLVVVSWCVDALVFDTPQDRLATVRVLQEGVSSAPGPDLVPSVAQGTQHDEAGDALLAAMSGNSLRASWSGLVTTPLRSILFVQAICLGLAGMAAFMSNVNLFSLNSMYANRLTRCYLGASRRKRTWTRRGPSWKPGTGGAPTGSRGPARRENPFTGFDPDDDIPLWKLTIGVDPTSQGSAPGAEAEYLGPHLIINTALNLVAGNELAWQDRKAESFVLTPTHCGSKDTGYAPTTPLTTRELSLGRAMSISGAAVDSNIGLHQSSALIALMTAFNARLGWWILNPNPATWVRRWLPWSRSRPAWDAASPSLALPLLLELLGQTDATRKYVHISDGGHFENLGVYELVRRRCRYIVCCDAGTDPQAADDNLANMIRLCRTDFGVRIEIDTANFAREGPEKLSRWHCAVGKIRYDDVDGGELPGVFVYLRTSMTGEEPPDVLEYAAKNPSFPWQTTLDQFFDEPQFESYRALGFHVAQCCFKDAVNEVEEFEPLWSNNDPELEFRRGNQRLFSAVQRRWAPSPSQQNVSFIQAARGWTEFQKALLNEEDLAALGRQIYPERAALFGGGPEIHAVAQMIQVMENAWVDLRLGGFRDLPMNRGWMTVFRRWAATPDLFRMWPILRGEFGQDFVKFCETHLALGPRVAAVDQLKLDPAFRDGAIAEFGKEFAREWPSQDSLRDLIEKARETWLDPDSETQLSLILLAPPGKGDISKSADKVACGLIFASRIKVDPANEIGPDVFEVFLWMKRSYRGMGLASRCAKDILTTFRKKVEGDKTRDITVRTRYPIQGVQYDEKMEFALWRSFFSHYDFSKPQRKAANSDRYHVIERIFKQGEPEL